MIAVSDAWKDVHQRFLLPETYVEIDCTIAEVGVQEEANASGTSEAFFSNVASVMDASGRAKYATNELNLWSLDGSVEIVPDSQYETAGYVSNVDSTGSVTLSFDEVHEAATPGIVITWGDRYGEHPSVFTVTAKNGSNVVAETTVTENTASVSTVTMPIENYNSITITVHAWDLPNRRARIEQIVLGQVITFTKSDILSFKHEQSGDLLSGAIPKCSIEFAVDNINGLWNPSNPSGMVRYLSDRQKIVVRYGMNVGNTIEWIKAGTFYLSEWDTPSNGLEARFVARDVFEFLLSPKLTGESVFGNLAHIITTATSAFLPHGAFVTIDASLAKNDATQLRSPTDGTAAEWVQKCANVGQCVIRYDRDGVLHIEPLKKVSSDYKVPLSLSYSHPELAFSKPLKEVSIEYTSTGGTTAFAFPVSSFGETQIVSNDFIKDVEAILVAPWVASILKNRKTLKGEFRADPRLDLYDIVTVESKYGDIANVAITNITYVYNGSFKASYEGRVLEVLE